ncbi:MAG TPA: PQQ-dependent sugar dehydrogenase [Lapillicoccus sp.]|nr:PQQ-dependent sugar dehydrogenase [Lapillicoccus sp.]
MRRRAVLGVGVLGALALAGCTASGSSPGSAAGTTPASTAPTTASSSASSSAASPSATTSATRAALSAPTDVATGLDVPWSAAVLPDGSLLVSERDTGQVKRVGSGGVETVGTVDGVAASGEGGLLGLAVDPATFSTKPVLYAYFTSASDNRVVTIALDGGRFGAQTPIITGIPKGGIHNGGRLKFGPDGFLYVTTGETGQTGLSQNRESLGGKILRVTTDGSPAPGNPFPGSRVWSYGHRNVQGIGWSANGQMWASEFGQNTWDELNVISPGSNYGWPTAEGIAGRSGFVDPVRQWSTADASPSGLCIGPDGAVFMAALRGQGLWKIPVGANGSTGEPQKLLDGDYGRLRDVFVGPDGNLWVITNNTGRGQPRDGDDRIVKLPQSLTG